MHLLSGSKIICRNIGCCLDILAVEGLEYKSIPTLQRSQYLKNLSYWMTKLFYWLYIAAF